MARTKTEANIQEFPVTEVVEKNTQELAVSLNANDMANAIITDKFEAIKSIGRIQVAQFVETVSVKLMVEVAIKERESKKYKGLPYIDADRKWKQVSTFDEYCEVFLGKTGRRIRDLISNYNQLGPDLFEQAEKIGFRQRDYNALKALPADDRQIIAQAIEEESLDKALDLMQQLAAKHQREKEALTSQVEELTKDVSSKDAVIAKKIETNTALEEELARARLDMPAMAHIDWPKAFHGYVEQVNALRKALKHNVGSLAVIAKDAMQIQAESEEEEAALERGREILAAEMVGIHNECIDMIEALGLEFDRSLGAFSDARIKLFNQQ